MRLRDALSIAMRSFRARRIDPREVEQLSYLFAAATAPPRADELVGHEPALAAFEQAGRASTPAPVRRRRMLTRTVAVKAFAGTALVLVGGTALAAETGNLPGRAQQHAHDLFSALGVPAPAGNASPAGVGPQTSRSTSTSAPARGTLSPSSPAVPGLCRAWEATRKNPKGKSMTAEAFRDLAEAAGGERRIAAFCAPLLADPTESATPKAKPTPSHPGNEKGKGKGRPTSTPRPNR